MTAGSARESSGKIIGGGAILLRKAGAGIHETGRMRGYDNHDET